MFSAFRGIGAEWVFFMKSPENQSVTKYALKLTL